MLCEKKTFPLCCGAFLALFLVMASGPYWVTAVGIPRQLKVFPGMELSLDLKPPFRLFAQDGTEVTGSLFNTEELGRSTYRLSLFGWLPISEVVVDVVPLIRVYPGGQSIGVLLSTDGLVVSQVGGVLGLDGRSISRLGMAESKQGIFCSRWKAIPCIGPSR